MLWTGKARNSNNEESCRGLQRIPTKERGLFYAVHISLGEIQFSGTGIDRRFVLCFGKTKVLKQDLSPFHCVRRHSICSVIRNKTFVRDGEDSVRLLPCSVQYCRGSVIS